MTPDDVLARMAQRTDASGTLLSLYCQCGDAWKQRRGEANPPPEAWLRAHMVCYLVTTEDAEAPDAPTPGGYVTGMGPAAYSAYGLPLDIGTIETYTGPTFEEIHAALIENSAACLELTAALAEHREAQQQAAARAERTRVLKIIRALVAENDAMPDADARNPLWQTANRILRAAFERIEEEWP